MTRSASGSTLVVHSREPYNAETALDRLRAFFTTAQSDFYIRSHGNVPAIDVATHRITVTGLVGSPLRLSVDELRARFPHHGVRAVLQCAGNRRADLARLRPVTGDSWQPGAIGNAEWTGVRLADVLRAAGAAEEATLHVAFESLDDCDIEGEQVRYGASIRMDKALSPDVLLAYAMNGEPLSPEHGYPLRVVVPGYAGVRSPKWLAHIEVRDTPADNPVQRRDYKLLPPDIRDATAIDWSRGIEINEMPVNAAICEPAPGARLPAGLARVRGYAMASTRPIVRVDVSGDGGTTWVQANLETDDDTIWSWTFWDAELRLAAGDHELVARAWDCAGQTQPSRCDDTWNIKGYLSAAWHRVPVSVA